MLNNFGILWIKSFFVKKSLMRLRILLLFIGLIFTSLVYSQQKDTLKIMTYNLLNYRNVTTYCTNNNNNIIAKEAYLNTIVKHVNPDILVCNEIGANFAYGFYLLTNTLNVNGETKWAQANYNATNGADLSNMLYFNKEKIALQSQTSISKDTNNFDLVRLIDVYRLYYKDSNLSASTDTVFFTVLAAHLKASNGAAERAIREKTTAAVMNYLDINNVQGNVFFCGDLNVYTASEAGFQNLINYSANPTVQFVDPIGALGSWNNNSSYAHAHTQSVRSSSNGCAAGGGMDDRFDFILMSDEVINNVNKVRYISNSYKALGQDGLRFNASINAPTNFTIPTAVADALYNMSDHLPVYASLEVEKAMTSSLAEYNSPKISIINPVEDQIYIKKENANFVNATFLVLDINGRLISESHNSNSSVMMINMTAVKKGTYILKIIENNQLIEIKKLIKI